MWFPNIFEQFSDINNSYVLSQFDFNNGYFEILVEESDVHETAFVLPL